MAYLSHPARIDYLSTTKFHREAEVESRIDEANSSSAFKSQKETSAIRHWITTLERAGETMEHIEVLNAQTIAYENLAREVVYGDEASIFDVSALIPKLPATDISQFSLANLVLPYGDVIYIHFGRQDDLVISVEEDLYLEGAYVRQLDVVVQHDEKSAFAITAVFSDPEFGDVLFDRAFPKTLARNIKSIGFAISHTATVEQGFRTLRHGGLESAVLPATLDVCAAAFNKAVASMIYLGTEQCDMEHGYFDGADKAQVALALSGNEYAAEELRFDGYSPVQFVGRKLAPIFELKEPNWGEEEISFKI
jgi:hypothetical protein